MQKFNPVIDVGASVRLLCLTLALCMLLCSAPGQRASAQELTPVLLVPGWIDSEEDLLPLRERFIETGWSGERVVALSFQDPVGSNRDHAREISAAVDQLRMETRSDHVDIVAFSMGGLAVRHYLNVGVATGSGRKNPVRKVVFLATPHRGTLVALMAWGDGGGEMEPGSDFLTELNSHPPLPPGLEALTIRTSVDLTVVPHESATLPDVPDLVVCCPTHRGLLRDEQAFQRLLLFLTGS
jgi:triacylglycerol lipase